MKVAVLVIGVIILGIVLAIGGARGDLLMMHCGGRATPSLVATSTPTFTPTVTPTP